MNDLRRISYFTAKAADFLDGRGNRFRRVRLAMYQVALAHRLAAEGYRWRPAITL